MCIAPVKGNNHFFLCVIDDNVGKDDFRLYLFYVLLQSHLHTDISLTNEIQ